MGSLLVGCGFFFATAWSRLIEIGSSNPISNDRRYPAAHLSGVLDAGLITYVIAAAILRGQPLSVSRHPMRNDFTRPEDRLLGATPKWQQWSILLGAGTSALGDGVDSGQTQ
ncbi:MAG: hypothetical protein U0872_15595 [Planctomycetaceae bacterium]